MKHRANNELTECVKLTIARYFEDLGDAEPHALYDMVISHIEKPLIETVLQYAEGNQSRAASILGINRNTLRKKMDTHNL